MNYILLRGIIILVILILTILALLVIKIKKIKIKKIFIIIPIILAQIIFSYPIEKHFMNFKKVDNAFHYYFPYAKILKKYEYNDYAYIVFDDSKNLFKNRDVSTITYITKKNDKWQIENILNKNCDTVKLYNKKNDNYFMSQMKIPNKKAFLIRIDYTDFKMEEPEVYDSLSSKIDIFYTKINEHARVVTLVVVFDESNIDKINEDYSIFFNKNDHKIFK